MIIDQPIVCLIDWLITRQRTKCMLKPDRLTITTDILFRSSHSNFDEIILNPMGGLVGDKKHASRQEIPDRGGFAKRAISLSCDSIDCGTLLMR